MRESVVAIHSLCFWMIYPGKKQAMAEWTVQDGLVQDSSVLKRIRTSPIHRHYILDPEPFATGQFAAVVRCRARATGRCFAAKLSRRSRFGDDCTRELHHEIALLQRCAACPRIVRLHDAFQTPTEVISVLEYAPGGDLQTILDDNMVPFEADVMKFMRQLLEGLAFLHERGIAHLDIKPQNLVMMSDFPDCDIKLCDFEISRVIVEGIEIREILGTPDYVAPEILQYEPITLAADMWSFGVTTYVLLTGFSPFGGETDQETFCNISRAQLDFPDELFEDISEAAIDLIKSLLVRDPKARPTAKQCLKHRWFSSQKLPPTSAPIAKSNENLRKYLSKSREALFERAIQQANSNNIRKSTVLTQYHKTRLCESHMSLVARSRESEHQLSPFFSRSREKLYGLRSLSKSQEVLDLYRSAGVLRSLTHENSRDIHKLSGLRNNAVNAASTTSIPASLEDDRLHSCSSSALDQDVENIETDKSEEPDTSLRPATLNCPLINKEKDEASNKQVEQLGSIENNKKCKDVPQPMCDSLQKIYPTTENDMSIASIFKEYSINPFKAENVFDENDCLMLGKTNTKMIEKSDSTNNKNIENTIDDDNDESTEPRYTVAQLITAFNSHQEIVTKSATKLGLQSDQQSSPNNSSGPNALRLLIPKVDTDLGQKFPKLKKSSCEKMHKNELCVESSDSEYLQIAYTNKLSPLPEREELPFKKKVSVFEQQSVNNLLGVEINDNKQPLKEIFQFNNSNLKENLNIDVTKDPEVKTLETDLENLENADTTNNNFNTLELVLKSPESTNKDVPTVANPDPVRLSVTICRSGSISSDMSGTTSTITSPWDDIPKNRSPSTDTTNPWGKVCTGSYTRAMEKFGGKSEPTPKEQSHPTQSGDQLTTSEKMRRKFSSVIKHV